MNDYHRARGILPYEDGDELPEDSIRRQREVLSNAYDPDAHRGLYRKYKIYKIDGSPVTDFYFVLKPDTDYAARVALRAYARATDNNTLAIDIKTWLDEIESRTGSEPTT